MQKRAFVIMPFDNVEIEGIYTRWLMPAVKDCGYEPMRVNEMDPTHQILKRIVHSIEDSELVLCVLTDLNPNVMYELGIAHSLTRRVIMVCHKDQKLPFDLKDFEVVFYDPDLITDDTQPPCETLFWKRLQKMIQAAEGEGLDNPVHSFSRMHNTLMNVAVVPNRPINVQADVLQRISAHVHKHRSAIPSQPYVIAITGASCLGKTIFSKQLSDYLRKKEHVSVNVLSLDGYMRPRQELEEDGLSGPCEDAHNLDDLRLQLEKLILQKETILFKRFDHFTGMHTAPVEVAYTPIVILEGVTAFSATIKDLVNLRIFLEGDDQWVAKTLRFLVGLEQRNRTINNSKMSSEKEFSSYINFLAPKKNQADILVKVRDNWSMSIEDRTLFP